MGLCKPNSRARTDVCPALNSTASKNSLTQYGIITANYWAFTLTDGALRMLIVLYFHQLGYSALSIAFLFLFYEFFGVVTNLVGGWLGAKIGLNRTMNIGLALQAVALAALLLPSTLLTIPWVMAAQALSGIAKDLNKMSAKSGIKLLVPKGEKDQLFKWVAALTGSKNTLKGVGFFLGGFLLWTVGFWWSIFTLLMIVLVAGACSVLFLREDLGKSKAKIKFSQLFSNSNAINWLSLARLFLFSSRDVWFVIALPIALSANYGWSHSKVGSFFALWIIGYGAVQSFTPKLMANIKLDVNGLSAFKASIPLTLSMVLLTILSISTTLPVIILILLLLLFGVFFAINSAIHSYLVVEWAREDGTSLDVGFYYMSNASGRLIGTILSGALFMVYGLNACLIAATLMLLTVVLVSMRLKQIA